MYCQECVDQKLQHRSGTAWDGQDASHLFGVIPNRHREHLSVNQILEEYTRRNLSYSADALNACLGIMKAANIQHWAGMSVETGSASGTSTLNLQWANVAPSQRRAGFPTWSWTSVIGQKQFPEIKRLDVSLCSISTPAANDQWQSVDEWMRLNGDVEGQQTSSSRLLQITAPVAETIHFPPDFHTGTASRATKVYGDHLVIRTPFQRQQKIFGTDMSRYPEGYMFKLHLDARTSSEDRLTDAVAIFLQAGSAGVPRTHPVLLILRPCGAYYERVGITDWNNSWRCERVGGHWESTSDRPIPSDLADNFPKQTLCLQ